MKDQKKSRVTGKKIKYKSMLLSDINNNTNNLHLYDVPHIDDIPLLCINNLLKI